MTASSQATVCVLDRRTTYPRNNAHSLTMQPASEWRLASAPTSLPEAALCLRERAQGGACTDNPSWGARLPAEPLPGLQQAQGSLCTGQPVPSLLCRGACLLAEPLPGPRLLPSSRLPQQTQASACTGMPLPHVLVWGACLLAEPLLRPRLLPRLSLPGAGAGAGWLRMPWDSCCSRDPRPAHQDRISRLCSRPG